MFYFNQPKNNTSQGRFICKSAVVVGASSQFGTQQQ